MVLDRGSRVGDSWSNRYDRLHLHTPRVQSALPGLRMPSSYGRWVAKDDMADYLARYAQHHGIAAPVRLGGAATRPRAGALDGRDSERRPSRRGRSSSRRDTAGSPLRPDWPGQETFAGAIVHATDYRRAAPFAGQDVLVVGAGNSGAEIAADLAENGAGRVRLVGADAAEHRSASARPAADHARGHPDGVLPRLARRPGQPPAAAAAPRRSHPVRPARARDGVVAQARATGLTPTIDVGLVAALRAGTVTPVAAVERFDRGDVVLADGTRFAPDAVIAATGYSTGLTPVVGHLGVLDARGRPIVHGTQTSSSAPGLRFVGLTNPLKGQLFQIGLDAEPSHGDRRDCAGSALGPSPLAAARRR